MTNVRNILTPTTPEGRAVKNAGAWQNEYFHKDHLGNTRVVYGYQKQVDEYKATMESPTPIATKEQSQFYNITTTRVTALNRTPASIDVVTPDKSAETNGYITGKAIGPAKMLQVTAGDRVQLEVFARYNTGTGSNNTLITNLASAVTTTFQVVSGEAAFTALTNNVPVQAATITQTGGVPKAYLFYILFNNSYVYQQIGYAQISSAASTAHQQLYLDITVPTGGYLYTYVAHESKVNNSSSVYFDDFNIIHTRNSNTLQVVQTTDYYPFGLAMAAQSYKKQSSLDNDYLYNGKELQDEHNLGWMDYGARMYMPDIGRWGVVDPLAEERDWLNPYNYVQNNPLLRIDPDGRIDIIDIEKSSGKINITKAVGDDIVRLVDKGTVKDQYTYGSNGSFKSENNVQQNDKGTTVTTVNSDKADAFYKFAAGSDVEFGKLEVQSPTGESESVVATSHEKIHVSNLPGIRNEYSNKGYIGILQSHSHPGGESVPSGHFGYEKDKDHSLKPYTRNGDYVGDVANAHQTRAKPGFGNIKFEVYNPVNKTKSTYDGVHRAKINIPTK